MEFNEKLQELRKRKGHTQEELAEKLYVSRTAISKWESGRGFPNIESLKAISAFFAVSLDELLSGEELLEIAENNIKEKERSYRDLIFGLTDCCMSLLLFLPLFGQKSGDAVHSVSLVAADLIKPYSKVAGIALMIAMAVLGVTTLALQNCDRRMWLKIKTVLSMVLSTVAVGLFIIISQSYAAILAFAFMIVKVFVLIKRQ